MKATHLGWARSLGMAVLLAAFVVGCASRPKIDWNARVGNYTYNQAVIELGPPDKAAVLNDKTMVAEWVLNVSSPGYVSYGFGAGYWGGPFWGGPTFAYSYPAGFYTRWLRLVFAPDGKLQSWQKFTR